LLHEGLKYLGRFVRFYLLVVSSILTFQAEWSFLVEGLFLLVLPLHTEGGNTIHQPSSFNEKKFAATFQGADG
jgi:hypothetical protein